jgi:hypothetical protein
MKRILLLIVILSAGTTSCSIIGNRSVRLPEVLAKNTCEPPCWFGITPGETTHEEALSLLSSLPFIQPETIQDWHSSTGAHIKSNAGASGVSVYYDAEQVVKVLSIGLRAGKLSFGSVIRVYGEPDKILAVQGSDSRHGMRYKIIYTENGLVFGGVLRPFDARKEQATIEESHRVLSIYFFNPGLIDQVFTDNSISALLPEVFHAGLQDWQGFGEIDPVEEFPSR